MSWQASGIDLALRALRAKRGFSSLEVIQAQVEKLRLKPQRITPSARATRGLAVTTRVEDGIEVYTLTPPTTGRHVFYLHGGAYVNQISFLHWIALRRLALESSTTIEVPIYVLAPHATADVTVPVMTDLLERLIARVGAENVTLAGDSAGGGLALAVAQELLARGSQPAQVLLISPWLDGTVADPEYHDLAPLDRMLDIDGLAECGRQFAGALEASDPRVSPLFGTLSGLAPVHVFTGTHDLLNLDARRLVERCAEAGQALTLYEAPKMLHAYPLLPIPEGRQALSTMASLVR